VVTIGLASDERGVLNNYKQANPKEQIVTINTSEGLERFSSRDYLCQKY
jgi:hypothetical protein